jgi:putative DNA primase/helicase
LFRQEWQEWQEISKAIAAARQQAAQEQQARAEQARQQAIRMWLSSPPANPSHPYLLRKRVGVHGIRQTGQNLLVPVCDLDGTLHGAQTVTPDGTKRFLTGTPKRGMFCLIGQRLTHPQGVYLCEGYATGASLHTVYGLPVLSCFDAGNLLPVARAYRERFPHIPLTVCADNDRDPASKGYLIGLTKAREVCAALPGVGLIVPEFPAGTPLNLSDFNDLVSLLGSSEQKETAA